MLIPLTTLRRGAYNRETKKADITEVTTYINPTLVASVEYFSSDAIFDTAACLVCFSSLQGTDDQFTLYAKGTVEDVASYINSQENSV